MMPQNSLIHKLLYNGVYEDTPAYLRNKLRVFNSAISVVFFLNLFYDIIGLIQGYYVAVAITSISLLATVVSFLLAKKRKYGLSFHFTILSAYFILSGFTFLFGGANSSYYFFLFVPVACNILFDKSRITIIYMVSSAVLMMYNVYWFNHNEPYYDIQEWMSTFSYPNMFFVVLLIYVGVRLFKEENNKYAKQIEEQNKSLEEKSKEITDSINYAKKIQSALIPSEEEFNSHFKESFVLFQPKDIVSGDFYWVTKKDNKIFYITGDCTGHGVPGGFMTMLGISFLDEIINEKNILEPAEILNSLRDKIIHTLKQTGNSGESKDGMDIVVCRLDNNMLTYAAANNSLYVFHKVPLTDSASEARSPAEEKQMGLAELIEYKPDKQPCGFHHAIKPFTQHTIHLVAGDCIYTFTDGLADQFGGPKGKKYKYKQLENLAISIQHKSLKDQKHELQKSFENWKGSLEQIDDVCIIGIKI